SSLYTLTTTPPPVPASGQVAVSSQVFAAASRFGPTSAPCSCRPLAHETLLWHHCLGHPSLPRLRGMASRALVSGLPRSLPPLPPGPAPICVPCVEGRQRAAPHSSSFPPTEAPLQTLHMDVWGPARVCAQGHERYFLLVVDYYSRYTTVFPLRSKDRGGEFSSDLLRAFCRLEGIRQTFTLPASPQQNGIAERRIGMVMDVARTSTIHAAAPHFLWPFAVQYAAHQINLQPRVSLPETTPTLRWTGKVGDASAFRVWGSRAFVRDTTVDKLSSRAVPNVFLGFPPDAPGWQFYHPTSRRILSSQDVTFDESVSYYRLFPHRAASPPPTPLFLAPDPAEPVEVAVDSGAARGAEPGGAETGGAEPGRAEPGGVAPEGTVSGGAEPACAASVGALGVPSRREPLSPQRLREWYSRRYRVAAGAGAAGAGAAVGAAGAGAAGGAAGAGAAGGCGGAGAGAGAAGGAAKTGDPRAEGTGSVSAVSGGAARLWPYFSPSQLQPASPLPGPSPYSGPTRGLTERREPESRPVSPESRPASLVRTVRTGRVSRPRLPPVPSTHSMTLRPSTAPQRVPLPSPLVSSLPDSPDPESDSLRAASPTVTRFLATAITDPLFESSAASALVAELVDFAAACRLDYAASLVAESVSASVCPPSVGGECALGTDVLEDRQEDLECFATASPHLVSMLLAPEGDPDASDIPTPRSCAEAIEGPYSSQWQAAMDAEMASWKSTGTYVDEVPPPGANIVSATWIFRVKRPPGSQPAFKAGYIARGFSQRQGVDFFQTFSPTPKMTTLRVLLHVAAQRDYELHSLDFSTAFLQGSLHEEIWLCHPPGFTGSFPTGTQRSLCRPVYGLRQAPREWHDTLRTTLATLGFAPSTTDPSVFLRTNTTRPPFYVLVYVDDPVFATADTEALAHVKSFSASASRTPRHKVHPLTESQSSSFLPQQMHVLLHLAAGSPQSRIFVTSQSSPSSFWFSSFSAGVTQHEAPRSPPFLYVDNKAMLALCQEHRLEHRTKHIALRYFLARELQQRGQLRLAYMASQANTADVFTKALQPCDHQRDAPEYLFCHPFTHRFFDSRDIALDDSVFFYVRYPHQGTPVAPFPSSSLTILPLVLPLRLSHPSHVLPHQSLQQPLVLPWQVAMGSWGAGVGKAGDGGAGSGGADAGGAGAGGTGARGPETGGATSGGPVAGGACLGGVGPKGTIVGGAGDGGADTGGVGFGVSSLGCVSKSFSSVTTVSSPSFFFSCLHSLVVHSPSMHSYLVPSSGPLASSLTVSTPLLSNYFCASRPIISCILSSLVSDPTTSQSCVLALIAIVTVIATTYCLYYAIQLVSSDFRPLSAGGELAFGCDVLEGR
ncbi:unnamed protein product, partial [Closterium sp. NIES-53]